MSGVITLDLYELAREWEEAAARVTIWPPCDEDELEEARETCEKCEDLCGELGVTPDEPDTLRWYAGAGNTLIREDTFEEYAREVAEDIHGDGARELSSYIDWAKYADGVRQDYYSITYDGHEWLRRA